MFRRVLILVLSLFGATAAWAAEVTITLDQDNPELVAALTSASLSKQAERDEVTDADALLAGARADYGRLLGALYDAGYYAPRISVRVDGAEAEDISPFATGRQTIERIAIAVETGPIYRFSTVQIRPIPPDAIFDPGLVPGGVARTSLMRLSVSTAIEAWRDAGHAKAALVSQDIIADHAARTISMSLDIDPGPRLKFGRIIADPDSAVIPNRQVQITGIIEGTIYDPAELAQAETRLQRTDIFDSAVIREAETPEGDTLPLILELTDRKPRRYGYGAELSTVEGGRLSAFWLHRNLTQEAVRLRVDAEVSGIGGATGGVDTKLGLTATRPATSDPEMDATITLAFEDLNEETYESTLAEITLGAIRRERKDLTLTAEVGYRYDDSTVNGVETLYQHAIIGAGATLERRNNTLNPTSGWYAEAELTGFVGLAGSETGLRGQADVRGYLSFGEATTLAGRLQLGSILGASTAGTPPSFLFYSGGGDTVRGQEYQSLGVPADDPQTGGRGWVGLSGELRQGITDAIQAVGFIDAGLISEEPGFGDAEWHAGVGIGARYNTPIGPIRVDLGFPIEGTSGGAVVYIGIGQSF